VRVILNVVPRRDDLAVVLEEQAVLLRGEGPRLQITSRLVPEHHKFIPEGCRFVPRSEFTTRILASLRNAGA
jgi:hypothetical protein